MALLRDVRVSLLGREWTESDVTECLRDCGWTVAEAAAMYERGTTLYSTRMRFCFEEALSADPLCIGPHNTVLGGIGASAPEDIAPGAYVAALAPMAPPRVLVVRADTGVGKTTQCRSMLTARTSGAFDEASSFVWREVHVGMIGVAPSIAEVLALMEACAGCGFECVLYQDAPELAELSRDRARLARAAVFTTYHSLVNVIAALCGEREAMRAETTARGQAVTAASIERAFDRMVAARCVFSYYRTFSVGVLVVDESHRVMRGVTGGVLCNPRTTYDALLKCVAQSDATVMMSANAGSAEVHLALRAVGRFALYWHLAPARPRRVTMYADQANFVARLARAVVRARREPGPVLLFCDNKRMAEQICERARAELSCAAGSVLLLSSPTGLEIIARLAKGDFSDIAEKVLVVATPVLSAAISIFGVVASLFMVCTQIVDVCTVQQMLARVRVLLHGGFHAHVYVLPRTEASDEEEANEPPDEASMHRFWSARVREFYRQLHIGQRATAARGSMMLYPIDLRHVVGVVDRAIAARFNAALARGMDGVACVCHMMLQDPCYAGFVHTALSAVRDAEYARAVRSDLLAMLYEVDDCVTDLALLPDEARLARGLRTILLRRRLSAEDEAKYNQVLRALRQIYDTSAPTESQAEQDARVRTAGELCAAFNWRAVPTDEELAREMLATVAPRLSDDMHETLAWLAVLENAYGREGHAAAMRARNAQGLPYFLDATSGATHALVCALDAVRAAACTCADEPDGDPASRCATCVRCADAPLIAAPIRFDTGVRKDEPVDNAAVREYLAECVCTRDAVYLRGASAALRELCSVPLAAFSWANFMALVRAVIKHTTGVNWEAKFVRSAQFTNRLSFTIHATSAAGVRFYAEALRTRAAMGEEDRYAPRVRGPAYRARIAAMLARIGPFVPIDGVE
jgi:hypothetical protein